MTSGIFGAFLTYLPTSVAPEPTFCRAELSRAFRQASRAKLYDFEIRAYTSLKIFRYRVFSKIKSKYSQKLRQKQKTEKFHSFSEMKPVFKARKFKSNFIIYPPKKHSSIYNLFRTYIPK